MEEKSELKQKFCDLQSPLGSKVIHKAMRYAITCHHETNHLYDGLPYKTHLKMTFDFGCKYAYLLPVEGVELALAACWLHDTIEDCRQTYNDVKAVCGVEVAEIVYALTNEKGKSRKERANNKYYEGIRSTPYAQFVKICDRLANVQYSYNTKSRMLAVYANELADFKKELWHPSYKEMFDELELLTSRAEVVNAD